MCVALHTKPTPYVGCTAWVHTAVHCKEWGISSKKLGNCVVQVTRANIQVTNHLDGMWSRYNVLKNGFLPLLLLSP